MASIITKLLENTNTERRITYIFFPCLDNGGHYIKSNLSVADAENLPFAENSFDIVYSYGVLHHTPSTADAIQEVKRVLRPGGKARIMIYHKYSFVGYMLWFRYALLAGHPMRDFNYIYYSFLESPGTKAYTVKEALMMFQGFSSLKVWTKLSIGDLIKGSVGQRHEGIALSVAKMIWPRWLIKRFFKHHGLLLMIEAVK